ncbi:MAG: hypothetical protein KA515_00885 [Candidatus Pacebacteria bacterium]|nr:hypothetical protein [Candidatus Paceibacterota bacterium]
MALKDHITDSTKVSEEEIEGIIADYIKYDPSHKMVVFLPKAQNLSNEKKILLYLVGLKGWQFVVKDNPPTNEALPRDIERVTGIRGGSLRPMLRSLLQSKMLNSRKGKYEIPTHNFGRVREIMAGGGSTITNRPANSEKPGKKKKDGIAKSSSSKKNNKNKPSLAETFEKLLNDKWFKDGKTLSQLSDKLEAMAVIVPSSHLPVHLLKACRGENPRLTRRKETFSGKKVWVYSQTKNE